MSAPVVLSADLTGPADAPAVVLVHSLGTDRTLWRDQVRAWSQRRRVLALDLRGHGASPAPAGPYSIDALALDVLAAADRAGLSRFDCVGISLGGLIGIWLAAHRPARVGRLVLANTAARIGSVQLWADRIRDVRSEGMEGLCEPVLARWLNPALAASRPGVRERIAEVFRSTSPEGYAGCCAALAAADLRPVAPSIEAPTLVIAGGLDVATPVSDARWLSEAIRGSRLSVLPDAAHLSNLDCPDDFTACVAEHLRASTD